MYGSGYQQICPTRMPVQPTFPIMLCCLRLCSLWCQKGKKSLKGIASLSISSIANLSSEPQSAVIRRLDQPKIELPPIHRSESVWLSRKQDTATNHDMSPCFYASNNKFKSNSFRKWTSWAYISVIKVKLSVKWQKPSLATVYLCILSFYSLDSVLSDYIEGEGYSMWPLLSPATWGQSPLRRSMGWSHSHSYTDT